MLSSSSSATTVASQSSLKDQISEANKNAVARILESEVVLVDIPPAIKVIPGLTEPSYACRATD